MGWVVHFRKAPYDVYCGRPGPWGNPFFTGTREENIKAHRWWVLHSAERQEHIRRELRGKVLGCWCAPQACHCDVLAEIANAEPAEDDAEDEALELTSGVGWPE
jgi:hypothetical protein